MSEQLLKELLELASEWWPLLSNGAFVALAVFVYRRITAIVNAVHSMVDAIARDGIPVRVVSGVLTDLPPTREERARVQTYWEARPDCTQDEAEKRNNGP